jgi:hypothetical protein
MKAHRAIRPSLRPVETRFPANAGARFFDGTDN